MLMCVRNMNDARLRAEQGFKLNSTTTTACAATTSVDCRLNRNCHIQSHSGTGSVKPHDRPTTPPRPRSSPASHPGTSSTPPAPPHSPTLTSAVTLTAGNPSTARMVVDLTGFLHGEHCREAAALSRGQIALLPVLLSPRAAPTLVPHVPGCVPPLPSTVPLCPGHTMLAVHQAGPPRQVPGGTAVSHCACCPLNFTGTARDSGFSESVAYCDALQLGLISAPVMGSDVKINTTSGGRVAMQHQQLHRRYDYDPAAMSMTLAGGAQYYNNSSQRQNRGDITQCGNNSVDVGSPHWECIVCRQPQQLQAYNELLLNQNCQQLQQQQKQSNTQHLTTCHQCALTGKDLSSPSTQAKITSLSGVYENLAFQPRLSGQTHIPRIVGHSPGLNGDVGVTPAVTTNSGIISSRSSPTLPDQTNNTSPTLIVRPELHHAGGCVAISPNLQQGCGSVSSVANLNIDHDQVQDLCSGSPMFWNRSLTNGTSDESNSAKTAMSSLSFGSDFGSDACDGRRSSSPSGSSGDSSGDCSGSSVASWAQQFVGAAENAHVWNTLMVSTRRLSKCGFYYEHMSMEQAKLMLRSLPVGSFLLRDSSNKHYLFSLSAKTPRGVTSVRIKYRSARFRLDSDEKFASQMPNFDCVLKLIQHYVQLSENKLTTKCMWLESSGRKDTPVVLTRPATQGVLLLTHLCRKVIHKTVSMEKMNKNLQTDFTLLQYLREYPYYV